MTNKRKRDELRNHNSNEQSSTKLEDLKSTICERIFVRSFHRHFSISSSSFSYVGNKKNKTKIRDARKYLLRNRAKRL